MLTEAFVIKLILQYIGGSKVKGNSSQVNANGKLVVIKAGGFGGLGGILGSVAGIGGLGGLASAISGGLSGALGGVLGKITDAAGGALGGSLLSTLQGTVGQLTGILNNGPGGLVSSLTQGLGSVGDVASTLLQNPLATGLNSIGISNQLLHDGISTLASISPTTKNNMLSSISSLGSTLADFTTHTNALSGLLDNSEFLPENRMTANEIMSTAPTAINMLGFTHDDVMKTTASLFINDHITNIDKSLDPTVSGGVTDYYHNILKIANSLPVWQDFSGPEITQDYLNKQKQIDTLANGFIHNINTHNDLLSTQMQSDIAAQQDLRTKVDTFSLLDTYMPEENNSVSSAIFSQIATPKFKQINTEVSNWNSIVSQIDLSGLTNTES